jgi:RNA polymerase sigma-70 factor (ECF subfamily)
MEATEFDAWYDASYSRVVNQVHAMTGDRDAAEECVQEAFAKAWSRRRSLGRLEHPDAWVRTAAYRMAVSRWRRARRGRELTERAHDRHQVDDGPDETRVALLAALERLPSDQRRAIVLHHLCDLSVAQVADEVGSPVGTVKARLSRGRTTLATLLALDEEAHRA